MPTTENKNGWEDFQEFLEVDVSHYELPKELHIKIRQRLFPNPWLVFGKIALIHLVFGYLSLSICNQFGLNPFGTRFSFSIWFMKIGGHPLCMGLCGVLFMGLTFVFSNLFLTLEELDLIRRHKWLHSGVFGMLSLAVFYFFGAHVFASITAVWFVGVLVGGALSLEASCKLRNKIMV